MNFTLKKSDLNFKVYIVPTKPTAPGVENDIAVISSVPMSNWILSPEKPSGMPRNDGDVWIRYSTKGDTRNVLKQNSLSIATISAWQYVDGAWVDREAVSCQGGAWVDWWNGEFYKNGNQYEDITGGWSSDGLTWGGGTSAVSSATLDTDKIVLTSTSSKCGVVATKNSIDLSGINVLYMRYTQTGSPGTQSRFGITLANEMAHGYSGYNMPASKQVTAGTNTIIEVNVSGVSSGRIFATCDAGNGATLTIYEVWGE